MLITKTIVIQSPSQDVWKILATDFDKAGQWATGVYTSEAVTDENQSMTGRVCDLTPNNSGFRAEENILKMDDRSRELIFDVHPIGAPKALPIRANHVTVKVSERQPGETQVTWVSNPTLKPHAYLFYPVVRIALGKVFDGFLRDLKHFAEHKKPSPQKLKESA